MKLKKLLSSYLKKNINLTTKQRERGFLCFSSVIVKYWTFIMCRLILLYYYVLYKVTKPRR